MLESSSATAAEPVRNTAAKAVEIRELKKNFGSRPALGGVSLDLHAGEILGLLGPNGAGKTTLVRCLMGRVVPDAGQMLVLGRELRSNSDRNQLGWVPQELALYSRLSARENLEVFGRYQGLSGPELRPAVNRFLEWAGLSDRAGDLVQTFSGGMKRRLNMAAGMIHAPRVVLLDEPTVGVDPQARERIYEMIAQLRTEQVSIIYTTHYMEEAERLCNRIAIIDHGRIIASGTRDELVRSELGGKRELNVRCAGEIPAALRQRLDPSGMKIEDGLIHASISDPARDVAQLLESLRQAGVVVLDLQMKTPGLEQVFLHLTGRELRE